MQVTGSNRIANIRYGLSIRPESDGQSFSLTEATLTEGGEQIVEIAIDTPHQILLPAGEGPSGEEAFELCGVEAAERVVVESEAGPWRLAALLPKEAIEKISKRHPGLAVAITSPLVETAQRALSEERTGYTLRLTKRYLYIIATRKQELLYAAALLCPTTADLLYALGAVSEDHPTDGKLWMSGKRAAEMRAEVKRYFKRVVLE